MGSKLCRCLCYTSCWCNRESLVKFKKQKVLKIKKILVSQPKPTTDKSPYFDLAEELGLKLEFKSFIKVEGVTAKEFRQERINILDFTGIVFTSRTAIDHFFRI